jgi:hypothetical protein
MDRYPVDDISGKTRCEMHQSMKNISMKVAVGYVLPSRPGQLWHGYEIRAGYARVRVDAIVPGYESLELDITRPKEETTLGEVLGGVILWDKKHIVFLGSAPRRPPLLRVCWGYTKWVYQRRSPKPASQGGPSGWYGGLPTGRPSYWRDHGGTGRRRLWRIWR